MLQMFYLDDAYVCNGFSSVFRCFCKCLRRMLQMFQLFQTMLQVFACRCCKIRSSIAHVAITMRPTCRSRQLLGCRRAGADVRTGEAEGVQVVPCGVRRCDVQVVWASRWACETKCSPFVAHLHYRSKYHQLPCPSLFVLRTIVPPCPQHIYRSRPAYGAIAQ
jgi:hypothetical protein